MPKNESNNTEASYKYSSDATEYANTDAVRLNEPHLLELVSILKNRLSPSAEKSILDVGCGTGRYELALEDTGCKITGIDPAEEMLAYAIERFPEMEFQIGSTEIIPFEESAFDGAFSIGVIADHAPFNSAALQEVKRILRPGAEFIFTCRNRRSRGGQIGALLNILTLRKFSRLEKRVRRTHWVSPKKVIDVVERAGFQLVMHQSWKSPHLPWPHTIYAIQKPE
jgi:SAM-dependent methyltransferase